MELRNLSVKSRVEVGSRAVQCLRGQGFIPAVLYSRGEDAKLLSIDAHAYYKATKASAHTQVYQLESDEAALNGLIALIKDAQSNPLTDDMIHVDLLELRRGERVMVTVGIKMIGESKAVKQKLAMLNQSVYELDVECLPRAIPTVIEIDISDLSEGACLHARDLHLPEGVVLKSDPALAIVSLVSQKDEGKTSEGDGAAASA